MSRSHRNEWSHLPEQAFRPYAPGRMRLHSDSDSDSSSDSSSSYGGYSNASLASYASQGWGGASAAANTYSSSSSSGGVSASSSPAPVNLGPPDHSVQPGQHLSAIDGDTSPQFQQSFLDTAGDLWRDNKSWLAPVLGMGLGPAGAAVALGANLLTDPARTISGRVGSAIGGAIAGVPGALVGSYAASYLTRAGLEASAGNPALASAGTSSSSTSSGGSPMSTITTPPSGNAGINTSGNPFTLINNVGAASEAEAPRQRWAADTSLALSTDNFDWQRKFSSDTLAPQEQRSRALMNDAADRAGQSSVRLNGLAEDALKSYEDTYKPIEDRFAKDAMGYDSDANVGRRAGMAAAAVNQQFSNATAQKSRLMGRYGLNPNSSAFAAQAGADSRAQALAAAGAQTKAAFDTMDTAINLRGKAAEFGQGKANTASRLFAGGLDAGRMSSALASSATESARSFGANQSGIYDGALSGVGRYSDLSLRSAAAAGDANAKSALAASANLNAAGQLGGALLQSAGGWAGAAGLIKEGAGAISDWWNSDDSFSEQTPLENSVYDFGSELLKLG